MFMFQKSMKSYNFNQMLADALLSEKYVMHQRIQTSNYGVHVVNPSDF